MRFVDESPLLSGLNYAKGQLLYRCGMRPHLSGSTAKALGLSSAIQYVHDVVRDYERYGGGGEGCFEGKDILEVGPGDSLGVGLLLLAEGAKSVTCIDGFHPQGDQEDMERLYYELYDSMNEGQRARISDCIRLEPGRRAQIQGTRLRVFYDSPIASPMPPLTHSKYDLIVSRAVLEHVADIETAWRRLVEALKPDGQMWHKIDFRSHLLFEAVHPLYFLTIPEPIWSVLSRPDPTLNRARLPEFRELSARYFNEQDIYYTHVLNRPEILPHAVELVDGIHYDQSDLESVRRIRSKLRPRFSRHTDLELLVNGLFLISSRKRFRDGGKDL